MAGGSKSITCTAICVSLFMVILTHELLCDYIFNFIRECYYYEKMCRFPLGIRKQQLLFPMFFLMLDTADYCNKISTSGRQRTRITRSSHAVSTLPQVAKAAKQSSLPRNVKDRQDFFAQHLPVWWKL